MYDFLFVIIELFSLAVTSIVHSKLDYCNSLYYNLPRSQITRLQLIQNYLARAVVNAPKSYHTTPVLRCLHWLNINERIEYKLLPLTYKVLTTNQPTSISPPPHLCSTSSQHSLFISGYPRSPTNIILPMHNRSLLSVHLPCLWNQLPSSLRQPHFSPSVSVLPVHAPTTSSHFVNSPLSPSITPSLFHSRLKTYLFHKSFPP